jgi:protein disulfide-isomerase A1
MAPSYAGLARKYNESGKNVVIAEVDATVHPDLATRFGIKGYPTLKFFYNGEPIDYSGAREADDIESWIEKKLKSSLDEITSASQLESVSKSRIAGVLYGENIPESLQKRYQALAGSFEKITFYVTKLPEAKELMNAKHTYTFALFRSFDDGHKFTGSDEEFSGDALRDFVNAHKNPTVIDFDEEAAQNIFGGQKTSIFFFSDANDTAEEKAFTEVAKSKKFDIVFSKSTITSGLGKRLAEYVGVPESDNETVRLVKFQGQELEKFRLEGVTVESLTKFIEDFNAGSLKAYRKSEKAIENDTADVKTIVGNNFDSLVIDNDKWVLLEIYAPWCGHCKALTPIYEELAKKVAHNKNLVIAKMDGTANEHPSVQIKGFPTIKFFKKGSKSSPADYEGGRTLEDFLSYLQKEMGSDWLEAGAAPIDEGL